MSRVMRFRRQIVVAAVVAFPASSFADPVRVPLWPDSGTGRLAALALIQTLNAEILASRSATAVLERWCSDYHLAAAPHIVAERMRVEAKAPDAEQLQRLGVASAAELKFRHVRLKCGERVLSEADNWYAPARLTAEMNRLLETTDTPFGKAVAALVPYRQTFSARLLWSPLPENWAVAGRTEPPPRSSAGLAIPAGLFEHRAVLYTRDNLPLSEVHEVYQRDILGFAPRLP
ncbi:MULTISPECIES: hypothetical protein [Methylococcus]|uniref:Uncharacterized protein n=1 Tax=Methylococcus capsulatus TaxID=414 RepID=A0ABZ2F2M8_METCP|nr:MULTISPECIES: hypothetical protein [Methylococcus]